MQNNLKCHPSLTHTQDILDLCSPLNTLGITAFSHLRIDRDGNFAGLANNPDFMKNYLTKGYYNADVHIKKNDFKSDECLLWDAIECDGATQAMLDDANNFAFKHIFTLIETQGEQCDYYHFGTHQLSPSINQTYINNIDLLKKFIAYFNEGMTQSPALMQAYQINFAVEKNASGMQLKDPASLNQSSSQTDQQRHDFLKLIGMKNIDQLLSKRQQECAELLMHGLTANDIASIMGISTRTVEEYMALIKKKLGARSKADLILKLSQALR